MTRDCRNPAAARNQRTLTCYERGNPGHYRSDCPELKNQNHGNQAEGTGATMAMSGHDTHVYCEGGQDDPAPAQAPPPPPATARTMPQRMARLEEDVHEIRRTLAE
ncbi:hypothetical protein Tco_0522588 [Tanacetum coccineum]